MRKPLVLLLILSAAHSPASRLRAFPTTLFLAHHWQSQKIHPQLTTVFNNRDFSPNRSHALSTQYKSQSKGSRGHPTKLPHRNPGFLPCGPLAAPTLSKWDSALFTNIEVPIGAEPLVYIQAVAFCHTSASLSGNLSQFPLAQRGSGSALAPEAPAAFWQNNLLTSCKVAFNGLSRGSMCPDIPTTWSTLQCFLLDGLVPQSTGCISVTQNTASCLGLKICKCPLHIHRDTNIFKDFFFLLPFLCSF